jgi:methyltransferase (TIGR00027 family)
VTSAIEHVSDTAFWVATHRAEESLRKDALFQDPLASKLVGDRGQKIARSMAATARYSYWSVILRTVIIDSYIRKYVADGCTTVINLGAGLDTRPYRMNLPADVQWIEIDFPSIIGFKNEKLQDEKPGCKLERIAVDVADANATRKLFEQLNTRIGNAVFLTEGVLPYLRENTVRGLATTLHAQSQLKYWIAEYYPPKMYPRFQSAKFKKSLGGAPFQFFPSDWFGLFETCGWKKKEMRYLYDDGERLGRHFPLPFPFSLLRLVLGSEAIGKAVRLQAYSVLEKMA